MTVAPGHRILFVCLGNICRSPTAEGVFRAKAASAGLSVEVDSAGTGDWHAGEPPDERAIEHAALRGYAIADQRARQVTPEDFIRFDKVLAMDASNLDRLAPLRPAWRPSAVTPELFMAYAPQLNVREVPDPYFGGQDGFELVLDLLEAASDGLIKALHDEPPGGASAP